MNLRVVAPLVALVCAAAGVAHASSISSASLSTASPNFAAFAASPSTSGSGSSFFTGASLTENTPSYLTLSQQPSFADNRGGDKGGDKGGHHGDGPSPVPEPGTLLLVGSGILGLSGIARRRFKG